MASEGTNDFRPFERSALKQLSGMRRLENGLGLARTTSARAP